MLPEHLPYFLLVLAESQSSLQSAHGERQNVNSGDIGSDPRTIYLPVPHLAPQLLAEARLNHSSSAQRAGHISRPADPEEQPGYRCAEDLRVSSMSKVIPIIFSFLPSKYKDQHRAVGVFVTRQPQILVLDPELAHEVLVGNFRCFKDTLTSSYIKYAKLDKYARRNAFWASGESWRRLRTDAQAGVSGHRLKQGYAIWEQGGKMLTDYMTRQVTEHSNVLETRDVS